MQPVFIVTVLAWFFFLHLMHQKTPCGFFPPSFLSPTFPFYSYCLKWKGADSKFTPLVVGDFSFSFARRAASPSFYSNYSTLCCVWRWDIFLFHIFPVLGSLVKSLVPVLFQRSFCSWPNFCWTQPAIVYSCEIPPCHYRLPAWECMQITGQEMSHLYSWDFLSFYVFHSPLFSLNNWISVNWK